MKALVQCLAIGAAGFFGAIARYVVALMLGRFNQFPVATMVINVSGCLFLGWFLTYVSDRSISDTTRLAIGVGFVGAYTTFSTFIFESNELLRRGESIAAIANIALSLFLGLLAVRLGMQIARH